MDIYHFDKSTGEYRGASQANLSPADLARGVEIPLIPAGATTQAPPATEAGEVAVRTGSAWEIQPDHRGETWYEKATGQPVEIKDIGEPSAELTSLEPGEYQVWEGEGWTTDTDAWWAAIRAERNAKLAVCDWTQIPDSPLDPADVAAWTTYRQALRDIPQTYADPAEVVWPAEPTE